MGTLGAHRTINNGGRGARVAEPRYGGAGGAAPLLIGGESTKGPMGGNFVEGLALQGFRLFAVCGLYGVQCTNNAQYWNYMKTANLTVRIDPKLKRQAQEASASLDVSLSQVFTAAAKGLVRQASALDSWRGDFAMPFSFQRAESEGEAVAITAERERVRRRIERLLDLEKRSGLDAKERAELTELSLHHVRF